MRHTFMLLIAALFIAGCGRDSNGNGGEAVSWESVNAKGKPVVGQQTIKTTYAEVTFIIDGISCRFAGEQEKHTLVKIDGDDLYVLEETSFFDLLSGPKERCSGQGASLLYLKSHRKELASLKDPNLLKKHVFELGLFSEDCLGNCEIKVSGKNERFFASMSGLLSGQNGEEVNFSGETELNTWAPWTCPTLSAKFTFSIDGYLKTMQYAKGETLLLSKEELGRLKWDEMFYIEKKY